MSDCYLCGNPNSHTYDCPKLNYSPPSPPIPVPVPISDSPTATFMIKSKIWRLVVVKPEGIIPLWATHAWYVDGNKLAGLCTSLGERALEWESHCRELDDEVEPGQTLIFKGLEAGKKYSSRWDLIVFGPL